MSGRFCRAVQIAFYFTPGGSGGTGRRTILRGGRRKAWGFESPLPHQHLLTMFYSAPASSSFGKHRTAPKFLRHYSISRIQPAAFLTTFEFGSTVMRMKTFSVTS